jgi:hypothetical protein
MTSKEAIKILGEALLEAQEHLEYCGYGDSWERECAMSSGLPETIDSAVILYDILEEEA